MIPGTLAGIARPIAPTLADIQRRAAELLDIERQLEAQRETRQAPPRTATRPCVL